MLCGNPVYCTQFSEREMVILLTWQELLKTRAEPGHWAELSGHWSEHVPSIQVMISWSSL